jgi:hypothetical protein
MFPALFRVQQQTQVWRCYHQRYLGCDCCSFCSLVSSCYRNDVVEIWSSNTDERNAVPAV